MHPVRRQTPTRRKIQDDVRLMFSARPSGAALPAHNSSTGPVAVILYLVLLGMLAFGSHTYLTYNGEWQQYQSLKQFFAALAALPESTNTAVQPQTGAPVEKVVFHPPAHDAEQAANYQEVLTFLYEPERFGHRLLGLPDINMTEVQKQWFLGLLQTESLYYHFDPWDVSWAILDQHGRALITSEEALCIGIGQGCNLSVCPLEMWKELKSNIWCSAKHFVLSWEEHNGDVDRVMADYKGAWLMRDTDGDGYKDIIVHDEVTGLPLIDPLLYSQVASVRKYVTTEYL